MAEQQTGVAVAAQAAGLVPAVQMKDQILALFDPKRKGFEEKLNPGELQVPRARMLQGLSEEVKQNPKAFYAGMLINSITKDPLTEHFIPIKRMPNTWIRFNARKTDDPNYVPDIGPGEVVWRSDDPTDPRVIEQTKFGPKGEPPAAISYLNFLCYFEGFTIPCVLSFGKTSYTAGKNFLTMAFGFGGDMFTRKYKLASKMVTKKNNSFYVLEATPAGKCSADELAIGQTLYDSFANVVVKVHEEDADAPEPGSEG